MMKRYNIALLLLLAIFSSCAKDKSDNKLPLADVSNKSNSSIRLFNFCGNLGVTINNVPLTNSSNNNASQNAGTGTQLGLSLFPTGTWTSGDGGNPFTVPNSLLDKNGNIHVQLKSSITSNANGQYGYFNKDTILANDVAHPRDYYLQGDGTFNVLDRDNVAPPNGQQFKIRIINLGKTTDMYNLRGPVSLTYADGAHVSPLLDDVPQNSASQYATVDYGSYLFRLYDSHGGTIDITKQYTEVPEFPIHDPCRGLGNPPPQENIMNQLRTFKPGGVYSVVITPTMFKFLRCDGQGSDYYLCNTYRIITEQDPGVNYTYARLQAVNAVPGKQLTIRVDGQPLGGSTLDYIGNSTPDIAVRPPYSIFIQGPHTVEVLDGATSLVKKNITLSPYDNYTLWAFPTTDDKVDVLFEANDMTGTIYSTPYKYSGVVDDGTSGTINIRRYPYQLRTRFLNLSPDLPYATFQNDQQTFLPLMSSTYTTTDTLRFPGAFTNLTPGSQPLNNVAILYNMGPYSPWADGGVAENGYVPQLIRVYASKPAPLPQIPGELLANVDALNTSKGFIANPALYDAGLALTGECGVYTVALVGYTRGGGTKAKMVLIKHNN